MTIFILILALILAIVAVAFALQNPLIVTATFFTVQHERLAGFVRADRCWCWLSHRRACHVADGLERRTHGVSSSQTHQHSGKILERTEESRDCGSRQ